MSNRFLFALFFLLILGGWFLPSASFSDEVNPPKKFALVSGRGGLYLAYIDDTCQLKCKKFDGKKWEQLGADNLGRYYQLYFAFGLENEIPTLSCYDSNQAVVTKQFCGWPPTWKISGKPRPMAVCNPGYAVLKSGGVIFGATCDRDPKAKNYTYTLKVVKTVGNKSYPCGNSVIEGEHSNYFIDLQIYKGVLYLAAEAYTYGDHRPIILFRLVGDRWREFARF